jgi:hypothetical protein
MPDQGQRVVVTLHIAPPLQKRPEQHTWPVPPHASHWPVALQA